MIRALFRAGLAIAGSVLVATTLLACAVIAATAVLVTGCQVALFGSQKPFLVRALERFHKG